MSGVPESIAAVLATGPIVHLTTLNQDGSPHVTAAWAGIEGDQIVMATVPDQRKLRNVRRDPRVALSFLAGGKNEMGLDEYVVIEGRARITEGGALAKLDELAKVYWGPDATFPVKQGPPGYITHVTIDRVRGVGPWAS